MSTEKPIWFIAEYLCEIPHISLLTPAMEKNLTRVDQRTVRGEMVGHRKKIRRACRGRRVACKIANLIGAISACRGLKPRLKGEAMVSFPAACLPVKRRNRRNNLSSNHS